MGFDKLPRSEGRVVLPCDALPVLGRITERISALRHLSRRDECPLALPPSRRAGRRTMTCPSVRIVTILAALLLLSPLATLAQDAAVEGTPQVAPPPEPAQPAYEVLRVDEGGVGRAYRVWEEWIPKITTTPDGGAWLFFTAQARTDEGYGLRRLFASRFDPDLAVWLPAKSIGNPATQFNADSVVDSKGTVHLVYSQRAAEGENTWSQLVYQQFANDAWTEPLPIAPHPDAGHQMHVSLAIDAYDVLHVVWRDQRFVSPEARAALPTNADLLSSEFRNGEWSTPQQVNVREAPDVNPAWPHLVADGDRLVLIWSIYKGTTAEEMKSAVRVEWSERPVAAGATWAAPQVLFERESGDAGGRLIDLAADPRGGAVVIYGLFNRGVNTLFMQRLDVGVSAWTEPTLLTSGDYGYLPSVTIAPDGTIYAVFNNGRNRDVDIGGLVTDPSGANAGAVTLTPSEGGITALASITLDQKGIPWVVYMHQPADSSNVTEIQAVRAATFIPAPPA